MSPQRIQRRRTRGWRMPAGAVYVGRPTYWGNPFTVGQTIGWHAERDVRLWQWGCLSGIPDSALMTREQAVLSYSEWIRRAVGRSGYTIAHEVSELAGRDLACWCSVADPCHADVLLAVANGQAAARG